MAETHSSYLLSSTGKGFEESSAGQLWFGVWFGCSQTVAENATAREGD